MRRGLIVAIVCASLPIGAASARAASLQSVGTFDQPIYVTSDQSNPDRLLVVDREGRIIQVQDGVSSTLADISAVVDTGGKGGLLSVAPAADFPTSGRLFVYYTGTETPSEIHIAELRTGIGAGTPADLSDLVTIEHPEAQNHYGGQLQIGPDDHLYASTGDGGGSDDQYGNAQNPESLLGKLLRIDLDADPPSVEVWSLGLRNPYRFSFDRSTGDLWTGDVGENAWEEVDFAAFPSLGEDANYGWACREGFEDGPRAEEPECDEPPGTFTEPVFAYANTGDNCAIIGGYVVRDASLTDLYGRYLYGDYCSGEIRSFDPSDPDGTDRWEELTVDNLNSFGEDSCGRLYAVSGDGQVWRLVGAGGAVCGASAETAGDQSEQQRSTYLGIRAANRKVQRRARALLTVWASPCPGRRGDAVNLWRGRKRIATRRLDRACTARFRPRITRRWRYRAKIGSDSAYSAAESRRLTIRPARRVKSGAQRHARAGA